jgi:hypothetical protein
MPSTSHISGLRVALVAAIALSATWSLGTEAAATVPGSSVPAKLVGVWHKQLTKAQWDRVGASRAGGVYTAVVRKNGTVIVYLPGEYRAGCRSCAPDFRTTFRTAGARLTLGNVPACSFKGAYTWRTAGRTLVLTAVADNLCPIREAFFGGRWKR